MKKLKYIGLAGHKGAGKSYIAEHCFYMHERRSFAQPMRDMLLALGRYTGVSTDLYGTPALKEEPIPLLGGVSFRKLMQTLGTEWGRECLTPDFWIKVAKAHEAVEARRLGLDYTGHDYLCLPKPRLIVYDDVRFKNEVDFIHEMGGLVVYVDGGLSAVDAHRSEQFEVEWADCTIYNNHKPDIKRLALPTILVDYLA